MESSAVGKADSSDEFSSSTAGGLPSGDKALILNVIKPVTANMATMIIRIMPIESSLLEPVYE
jgi:hypothetical protein